MGLHLHWLCPACDTLWGRYPTDDRVAYYQEWDEEREEHHWTMNVERAVCPDCKKRGSRK